MKPYEKAFLLMAMWTIIVALFSMCNFISLPLNWSGVAGIIIGAFHFVLTEKETDKS